MWASTGRRRVFGGVRVRGVYGVADKVRLSRDQASFGGFAAIVERGFQRECEGSVSHIKTVSNPPEFSKQPRLLKAASVRAYFSVSLNVQMQLKAVFL